jgi:cytochrome c1
MADNLLSFGPNITFVKRSPEYLQAWLADPSSLKPDTQMPNLHLGEAEIETLVAFLQTDAD